MRRLIPARVRAARADRPARARSARIPSATRTVASTRVTWTAVTLYSGQFVAQSELSVVTTLAPDRGMEGRVDHTGLDALGDYRAQDGIAGAAAHAHPVAVADAALLGVVRVDLQHVLVVPRTLAVRRVCAPTLYWLSMRPVVRSSGILPGGPLSVGTYSVMTNRPLPRTNSLDVHGGCPIGRLVIARPLHAAEAVQLLVTHALKGGCQARDLVHDLGRVVVVHRVAERVGQREW